MNRAIVLSFAFCLLFFGPYLMGASKVYRYRCPKCKLIQEYEAPGTRKCPNDGRTMIRVSGSFTSLAFVV